MNWIDRPIEAPKARLRGIRKVDPAEVERRRQAILEYDRQRKRDAIGWRSPNERRSLTQKQNAARRERCDLGSSEKIHVPVVKVLVDWHQDSEGCMARTMGGD